MALRDIEPRQSGDPAAGPVAVHGRARPHAPADLECSLLGVLTIRRRGQEQPRWRTGRGRSLFEYLLVNHGVVIPKEQLASVLWEDADDRPGANSLKVLVHGVRRTLRGLCDDRGQLDVEFRDVGYVLEMTGDVQLDFAQFESLSHLAMEAQRRGDDTVARGLYEEALQYYSGDFLVGQTEDWVIEQRQWLRELALRNLLRLAQYAVDDDDLDGAVTICRRIYDLDPTHEDAYRVLMYVHARRGEIGQVKRWHELCVRRLERDLDVEPDPATDELLEAAIRREPVEPPSLGA